MISFLIYSAFIAFLLYFVIGYISGRNNPNPTSSNGSGGEKSLNQSEPDKDDDNDERDELLILFGSQKGRSEAYATQLYNEGIAKGYKCELLPANDFDFDTFSDGPLNIVIISSTYEGGVPPNNLKTFYANLDDHVNDFRVPKTFLSDVRFALFGCGNSLYKENYNKVARGLNHRFRKLGAQQITPLALGNEDEDMDGTFQTWINGFWRAFKRTLEKRKSDQLAKIMNENDEEPMVDMEDLGEALQNELTEDEEPNEDNTPLDMLTKEMLNPTIKKSLQKQGYKILGSHSGVKICRWTKAMLRGRGGCYKHTFYGITSYQCMEMTPSLACANKCVFCWRHHSNPVGTKWKWKVDDPEFLVEASVKNHIKMMKTMKGVPGVKEDRFEEATSRVKHCALSLVGEPIIYPHINNFIDLLHEREISSFLVTNAQFPEKIETLRPVTQLYISIDASTKESLKKIDRPLFTDFWERFLSSIDSLSKKGQRTVFRLTLVKQWNMEELQNYGELIARGRPDFIEIKGVTYCGKSDASSLTIKNTPFHEEVISFSQKICDAANKFVNHDEAYYEIASEHEHSLCILLANKNKFYRDNTWYTWIDYPKFHELVNSGEDFTSLDYIEPTPHWAAFGAKERGFDPEEERYRRKKKDKKE